MRFAPTAIAAVIALSVTQGPIVRAQNSAPDDAHRILSTLYSAISKGDSARVSSLIADDLVWVVGANGSTITKSQLVLAASTPSAARFEIDSLRTRQYGETTVTDYVRRDHWQLGRSEVVTSWRALAVIVRRNGDSQIVRHALSWLARPVQPIAVDSTALQPFVGRYQVAPGYVDNVHWESGHLVATAPGQAAGAQLIPVSINAFSPDGIGALITFERDAAGHVVDYIQAYPDGRMVRARRLR